MQVGGCKLNVWDIGGRSTSGCMEELLREHAAIVYTVDSADKRRADECAEELETLMGEEELAGVPVLVFKNKQDLLNAMIAAEIIEALELSTVKDWWIHVQACSAKTGAASRTASTC